MKKSTPQPAPDSGAMPYRLALSASDKKYLLLSVLLHIGLASVLFVSWEWSDSQKPEPLPPSIQANVLTEADLLSMSASKRAEQEAMAQKKRDDQRRKEQQSKEAKKRAIEVKRQAEIKRKKAQEKQAAEKKRQEAAAKKKALIQKKEKERQESLRREKAQREAETKKREQNERKAREEKARLDEAKRIEREQRLADRLNAIEQALSDEAKALRARQQAEAQAQREAQASELTEKEKFMSLIRGRIENRWHIPPELRQESVLVRLKLLPNGELSSVVVVEKSGNVALDQSALNAINSIRTYPVPENRQVFEKYFRQFTMRFTPNEVNK